ncbi:hypothetical protein AA103196_1405 [Ameyamaea chiangmaiensis NBRC 103196]|nr:hypothetical protein AA103196_1405 [Ameyamaea chiangmaiensis NBRC 103196]
MLVVSLCAFLPSLLGLAGAALAWDDPTIKAISWTGLLRIVLSIALMGLPICVAGNIALTIAALRGYRPVNALTWVSFIPTLLVVGGIGYLFLDDTLDERRTRQVERSYDAIVAAPQMAKFHAVTQDLSPYLRLDLARRAQQRLTEHGIAPPATVDELYTEEYRVMVGQRDAFRRGETSKAEYQQQQGIASQEFLEMSVTLGKPRTIPEAKFLEITE